MKAGLWRKLGRIERTLFMLDWLESPRLRQRCHAGLNKMGYPGRPRGRPVAFVA